MEKDKAKAPEVELIGIYKEKYRKGILATFHVYLADKDIDLRGGIIFKTKGGSKGGKIFIQMPQGHGTEEETGKRMSFPIVSFTDSEYEKAVRYMVIGLVTEEMKKMKFD